MIKRTCFYFCYFSASFSFREKKEKREEEKEESITSKNPERLREQLKGNKELYLNAMIYDAIVSIPAPPFFP